MKRKLLLLSTVTVLAFPKAGFGQSAPNLGTTSSFAFFTAVGAFTVNGASIVTGDVGTNVGAFTGFPPGVLFGQQHVANSTSAQAAIDVAVAYNELVANTCPALPISSALQNQVLTPGVSCVGAAATLNGNLTLDAQGNPNAIFIIKIDGPLSTSTGSMVLLINGASPANVFFQVNGQVELGNNSAFVGTIIANGAIILLEGASLRGRGLSIAGAITLNNARAIIPSAIALPVTLVSFTAVAQDDRTVNVAWTTSLEINNKGFLIERSKDLKIFEKVSEVNELAPMSNALKNYSLIDYTPYLGTSYYRLSQTDLDGKITIHRAVSVILRDEAYGVYPNPVISNQRIRLRLDDPETATVNFYNITGRSIPLQQTGIESGNLTFKALGNLSTGVYLITVEERGQTRTHRLVVD